MSAVVLVLAIAAVVLTEWLRHRPQRLTQGTQHIALVGYTSASLLLGLAFSLLFAP